MTLSRYLLIFFLALPMASARGLEQEHNIDPWEPMNRRLFAFNEALDKYLLRPVAKGYTVVMPDFAQRGVSNFISNIYEFNSVINSILQGRLEGAAQSGGRFVVNSTLGLVGFFDVATPMGIKPHRADFGQTLAVWGWKDSRYLVMPIFGPYTARDFIGRGFYGYFHPVSFAIREYNNYIPLVVDLISLRAELLPFQEELDAANDPYVLVRDVWLQNREFRIYDGEPPEPDYDALLEEY